jgi:hypothetical protein
MGEKGDFLSKGQHLDCDLKMKHHVSLPVQNIWIIVNACYHSSHQYSVRFHDTYKGHPSIIQNSQHVLQ